nr:perilipin-3-like isoform X2 [Pogona vitticeps]
MMISPKNFTPSSSSPSVTSDPIMPSTKPESRMMSSDTSDESFEEENILKKVGSLPLVCSVCDLVSSNYTSLKRKNSCLQTVCDGAEKSVKSLTEVAVSKAQPILTTLEPQLATANKYACRGLDKVEAKLPILQQTAEQVVSDTKELMSSKVSGAKDALTRRLSSMVCVTKDAVQGSMKTTKSMVTGSVSMMMGTKVGQMAKDSVEAMLGKSHAFVTHCLLAAQEDTIQSQTCCEASMRDIGQQLQTLIVREGYLACLISLLNKFHRYTFNQSRRYMKHAKQNLERVLVKQYLEWKAWLIALYYTVTLPLRTVYLIILFTMDELLSRFYDNVPQASYILEELQMALSTLDCLQDLCWRIFTRVWEKMLEEENLSALLNYVAQALPFCFFANYCKCRTSTNCTIRALKVMQKMQTSRDSLLRLEEPRISLQTAAT